MLQVFFVAYAVKTSPVYYEFIEQRKAFLLPLSKF